MAEPYVFGCIEEHSVQVNWKGNVPPFILKAQKAESFSKPLEKRGS